MNKFCIFTGLYILFFNVCNNIIENSTFYVNSYAQKRSIVYNNNTKRYHNNYLHYIYNLCNNNKRRKEYSVKICTHNFGKTYPDNRKNIFLRKKPAQARKLNKKRHRIFFFSKDGYTRNCYDKSKGIKGGKKKRYINININIKKSKITKCDVSTNFSFYLDGEKHTNEEKENVNVYVEKGNITSSNQLKKRDEDGREAHIENVHGESSNSLSEKVNDYISPKREEEMEKHEMKEENKVSGEHMHPNDNLLKPSESNEENLNKAIKKAEEYIKGKQDNIIEKREMNKKKKVIENLKGDDVFTDKFLDLSMYDLLKHVYKKNIYVSSKNLVDDICKWLKNIYTSYLKSEEEKKKKKVKNGEGTANGKKLIVEKDISDNYSRERKERYFNNFRLEQSDGEDNDDDDDGGSGSGNDDETLKAQLQSLKLYNKKNLSKYFYSFNRGNILKQVVTEGEEEQMEEGEKQKDKKGEVRLYDDKDKKLDEEIEKVLSNPIFDYDTNLYIDKKRYMKSNVTIEFNIYDSYKDRVILNNKNTNSTMLEFPLMYSHSIIQKCILTMKKLEKAIFYINNSLLFRNFTSNSEPTNDEDRNVYDVITNENWIKMEIYLCNIYGINERWEGITPDMFTDEEKANSFLKEYSFDSSNNIIGVSTQGKGTPVHESSGKTQIESTSTADKGEITQVEDANRDQSNNKNDNPKLSMEGCDLGKEGEKKIEGQEKKISEKRAEIIRRSEEYETKKELEIKTDFLMKKLENEMKYDPNHYMWQDLYPQLGEHDKQKTDKYFDSLKKEMSEHRFSRGYTDNIKNKQSLKGYDIGEKIEGKAKYYVWQETIHSFCLYFPLRPYVKKKDIIVDMDNNFFFLSILNRTIIKDFFIKPINSSDSIWSLSDNEEANSIRKKHSDEFPVYELTSSDDQEVHKMMKTKFCLIYNIYKDNNHKYMWGSVFKAS
ncbi:conserved Plasmodium protein, unknown function [Plasmodium malariae]|uniref:CS domain-containing protein n=1 Tax=Plasmodium malariae TaxID=5858 RepID=A0A1A8X7Z6_PLAMA|nr:conserved Plasmodium protein, unknown function [Plasmodium malariae]